MENSGSRKSSSLLLNNQRGAFELFKTYNLKLLSVSFPPRLKYDDNKEFMFAPTDHVRFPTFLDDDLIDEYVGTHYDLDTELTLGDVQTKLNNIETLRQNKQQFKKNSGYIKLFLELNIAKLYWYSIYKYLCEKEGFSLEKINTLFSIHTASTSILDDPYKDLLDKFIEVTYRICDIDVNIEYGHLTKHKNVFNLRNNVPKRMKTNANANAMGTRENTNAKNERARTEAKEGRAKTDAMGTRDNTDAMGTRENTDAKEERAKSTTRAKTDAKKVRAKTNTRAKTNVGENAIDEQNKIAKSISIAKPISITMTEQKEDPDPFAGAQAEATAARQGGRRYVRRPANKK
jgi:hypothetical protein